MLFSFGSVTETQFREKGVATPLSTNETLSFVAKKTCRYDLMHQLLKCRFIIKGILFLCCNAVWMIRHEVMQERL